MPPHNRTIMKGEKALMSDNAGKPAPFFIIGCGRSGTTLLRAMLNHHADIAIPLESLFIIDYLRAGRARSLDKIRDLILREHELAEWGIDLTRLDISGSDSAREIIEGLHEAYADGHGKSIWGQKTPRFVRHAALLKKHFPDAGFIHVIRDPRAVASSLIRSRVHRSNALFASRRWLKDVQAGLDLKETFKNDYRQIRYEDLILNPRSELERICDFIGVTFDENMLLYHQKGLSEYGRYYSQIHSNLGRKPDERRITAWRAFLSGRQQSLVESVCGDLMRELGYEKENPTPGASSAYLLELRIQRCFGLLLQLNHYAKFRKDYIRSFIRRKFKLGLFFRDLFELNY